MIFSLIITLFTQVPSSPERFWIWPDFEHALRWIDENPKLKLCITQVPDGFATKGC